MYVPILVYKLEDYAHDAHEIASDAICFLHSVHGLRLVEM